MLMRGVEALQSARDVEATARARERLKRHIESLSIEPDLATEAAMSARLSGLDVAPAARSLAVLRRAMANTRMGIADDLAAAPEEPGAFQRRLAELISQYEAWIGRFRAQ